MLIDTLKDTQLYMLGTLIECMQEADRSRGRVYAALSYERKIRRRLKSGYALYQKAKREPTNGWIMFTGKLIREIVAYETKPKKSE